MNEKTLATFDYSLTSPALTVWNGKKYTCVVISSEKKIDFFENETFDIRPMVYPFWRTPQERYEGLTEKFMKFLKDYSDLRFGIESYSMGSKGRVFDIAEATQTLKYSVWKTYDQEMSLFAPTFVKKHFTGKGNADKEKMAEAFREKFGFWMHEAVNSKIKGSASDLVDSVAVNLCLQSEILDQSVQK